MYREARRHRLRYDVATYLYCGISKLIAKHELSARVIVEEADCGCAACVDMTLDVGSVALEGVGI